MKTLSKGNQEKVALILVMSRDAKLYILDEPIGGVDPAARDYILHTILNNYNEHATILISTHLISDIENILDRVLFIQNGELVLNATVDDIRSEQKNLLTHYSGRYSNVRKNYQIRYESHESFFLIIIHAFSAYICIFFIRILITGRLTANNVHNLGNTYFLILGFDCFFWYYPAYLCCFATSIIIAVHFYKSTYSDEGYLTHTLPVKKGTLLFAKVIAGTIWCIIDIIGLFAAIYIAASGAIM